MFEIAGTVQPPTKGAGSSRTWTQTFAVAVGLFTFVAWGSACSNSSEPSARTGAGRPASTTSAPSGTTGAGPAEGSSTTAPSAPSSTTPARPRKAGQPITIAFAGDNNGEGLADGDMANAMAARLGPMRDLLSGTDLTVVNLESAITDRGAGAAKAFTFRAPPSILDGLKSSGVDIASMANNHGMDSGLDGLQDSLAARKAAPIPVIGIGADDAEAFSPAKVTVKDQRVSVIAATQVLDSNLATLWTATADHPGLASAKRVDRLVAEVQRARADSDVVIVFLHWGVEKSTCPSASQQQLAGTLADAGADLIVGGHAHRLQGGGFLGKAFVHYGLGNFGFRATSPDAARTGVLIATVDGGGAKGYQWHPGLIRDATPTPLSGTAAQQAVDHWNGLRGCAGLTANPT